MSVKDACGWCGGGVNGFMRRNEAAENHAAWCPRVNPDSPLVAMVRRSILSPSDVVWAVERHDAGHSWESSADSLGVNRRTITRTRDRYGMS